MKKIIWNLTNGLLAGIMIAVGGTVFLACFGDGSMVNKTIGAFFFSIALLSICYKGYSLYTGKIGFIPEKHDREAFSVLLWGLLGNLIATVALGYVLRASIPTIGGVAETLCAARLTQAWWQTLIRGIFCGILMYMAVSIYRDKKSISGILFCVPVFILAGFEHSVANMFYFGAAGMFFSVNSIIYLAIVVLGNTIGGMLMPVLAMIKPKEA
ncbi:MAG: formate/nitrite transporter family protein [Ruminococcaceae bacterium]|nr:formate/nitrite transporter family protein [Oscillospiraceae bacterium]